MMLHGVTSWNGLAKQSSSLARSLLHLYLHIDGSKWTRRDSNS